MMTYFVHATSIIYDTKQCAYRTQHMVQDGIAERAYFIYTYTYTYKYIYIYCRGLSPLSKPVCRRSSVRFGAPRRGIQSNKYSLCDEAACNVPLSAQRRAGGSTNRRVETGLQQRGIVIYTSQYVIRRQPTRATSIFIFTYDSVSNFWSG